MKYPMNEFKSIQAFSHSGSCAEIQFYCQFINDPQIIYSANFEHEMMKGYTYYKKAKNFKYMIRNIIVNAEML